MNLDKHFMKKYEVLSFEKEESIVSGTLYVALVKKDGEDQPFRVSIEHFKTPEEARAELDRWIKTQEEDDALAEAEKARLESEAAGDATLEALNKDIT